MALKNWGFLGYGLTETSPAAMLCPRNNCKLGAVGVMLPNLEGKVRRSKK